MAVTVIVSFTKLHGAGNDFVLIDVRGRTIDIAPWARFLADRHYGIGCDQLLLLDDGADGALRMTVLNADGSSAEMCGNGIRAFAHFAWTHGIRPSGPLAVATGAGLLTVTPLGDGDCETTMGVPTFTFADLAADATVFGRRATDRADGLRRPDWPAAAQNGIGVSMGNPHLVFFVSDPETLDLAAIGPRLEHDPAFAQRTNVSFAACRPDGTVAARVWERGAGATLACGTAACAIAVAAITRGLATSPVRVRLPGGTLTVSWRPGESVRLAGPAAEVFSGTIRLDAGARANAGPKEAPHV